MSNKLLSIKDASKWASSFLNRDVTESNISYLIQYGKVNRYDEKGQLKVAANSGTRISLDELKQYYTYSRESKWKEKLGEDIDWNLGFENLKESDRTKHVHRLHPYKGKFIPQLAEYFLDKHQGSNKKSAFFQEGDIILDPFVGSGTTLVQCLELGLHSIGIDISEFNCIISQVKTGKYNLRRLEGKLLHAQIVTSTFSRNRFGPERNTELDQLLNAFDGTYYPTPEFKKLIYSMRRLESKFRSEIQNAFKKSGRRFEDNIGRLFENHRSEVQGLQSRITSFLNHNNIPLKYVITPLNIGNLVNDFTHEYERIALNKLRENLPDTKHEIQTRLSGLRSSPSNSFPFLSAWFTKRQRIEMQYYFEQIKMEGEHVQNLMKTILSRTIRSCRATKHVDLATLVSPQFEPYYCRKHYKVCRPVSTIINHLRRYTIDTIKRLKEFDGIRKKAYCEVINDDSRYVDIFSKVKSQNREFYELLRKKRVDGIFTSPPYVGQIDYHEQHAYAYELFNIKRRDSLEIGRKSNGKGKRAQSEYISGISKALINLKDFLSEDAEIFIVANDKMSLYPKIADASGLNIIKTYKRPVLNRTERDKQPYSESIFHMRLK